MKPIIDFLKTITEISSLNRITPEKALNKLEDITNYKPQY